MTADGLLILDFGGDQAQLTARKLRGERFFCEILPCETGAGEVLRRAPKGVLLVGGADGPGARAMDGAVLEAGIPVLAMGYAARALAEQLGGRLLGAQIEHRTGQISFSEIALFEGLSESERYFDRVDSVELPEGFAAAAFSAGGVVPAFACEEKHLYALQFYAESNDPDGLRILANFAGNICGCAPWWSMEAFVEVAVENIRRTVGEGSALIAISGGVDSSVCATLMYRAIGDKLRCLYVNTGLMRSGETALVTSTFRDALGIEVVSVDAGERILKRLEGTTDAATKRRVVEEEVQSVLADEAAALGEIDWLSQGTIYPDVLSGTGCQMCGFEKLIEPLRLLFKDEVRQLGEVLGVPKDLISRQPFPEPGLALRIVGAVTREKLGMLAKADAIFRSEIVDAGLDRRIWQYFAVLTDIRTRAQSGAQEYAVALRAVSSQDALTFTAYRLPYDLLERVTARITQEVEGVNRVLYDVTGRPTAAIEWE